MCQSEIISQHIGRIGRRSFDRRIRLASPFYVEKRGDIARILNEVDKLCDRLHDEFSTITEEDYHFFSSKLAIVINTLKSLRQESLSRPQLASYNERLRQQISELEEIVDDIKIFRVEAPKDKGVQQALSDIGTLDFSKILMSK